MDVQFVCYSGGFGFEDQMLFDWFVKDVRQQNIIEFVSLVDFWGLVLGVSDKGIFVIKLRDMKKICSISGFGQRLWYMYVILDDEIGK